MIELLAGARQLGFRVEISDEGGYWPRRNRVALRQNVDEMNAVVAAAAGVLKDQAQDGDATRVQAPILDHPQFEHLEAEGDTRGHVSRLRKLLR